MSKIVGIDLGTTNSLVATVDSGIPLIIPDAEGNRLTPSVVHFSSGVDEPIVGHGFLIVFGVQVVLTILFQPSGLAGLLNRRPARGAT